MPLSESMRAHNRSVIREALQSRGGSVADKECLSMLQELGEFVLKWIKDKTYTYEDQTYNLTDSTGCAIYKQGRLTSFKYYADKQASGPRKIYYHRQPLMVRGRQLLNTALRGQPLENMGTYTLVVLSEAPYGVWVNESLGDGGPNKRGKGWFDDLKKDTEAEFERIRMAHKVNARKL